MKSFSVKEGVSSQKINLSDGVYLDDKIIHSSINVISLEEVLLYLKKQGEARLDSTIIIEDKILSFYLVDNIDRPILTCLKS